VKFIYVIICCFVSGYAETTAQEEEGTSFEVLANSVSHRQTFAGIKSHQRPSLVVQCNSNIVI